MRQHDEMPEDNPKLGFRLAAGMMDFLGVMACTVLIVLLMAAVTGLFSWLRADLNTTFSNIGKNINEAVVIDAHNNQ